MSVPNVPDDQLAQPREPEPRAPVEFSGIIRRDAQGRRLLDALAGRTCLFGFGFEPLAETIRRLSDGYLGDPLSRQETEGEESAGRFMETLREGLGASPGPGAETGTEARDQGGAGVTGEGAAVAGVTAAGVTAESVILCESADAALETVIAHARRREGDGRFRTVALVGSDHGRSGVCRSASGRPELHRGLGPMMPGFTHVPAGDTAALDAAIDEETACVLLTPMNWSDAGRPLDRPFLQKAAECCRARDALLVIDESQLCFGATGGPFSFREIAEVEADAVVLAGGLFGGVSGGLVLASGRLTERPIVDIDRFPLQRALLETTLHQVAQRQVLAATRQAARPLATKLAETIGGFEFVRDLHVLGMTIGIETDLNTDELLDRLKRQGVRADAAGDHAIGMQLPLVLPAPQLDELFRHILVALESLERQAAADPLNETSLPS